MLKFAISKQFRSQVSETITISDPWGQDLNLVVLRKGSKEHRRYERRAQTENPLMVRVFNAMAKAGMKQSRSLAATPEEAKRARLDQMAKQLEAEADKIELTGADVEKMMRVRLDEAVALIQSWSGKGVFDADSGQPIPCTEEAKRELLEQVELIPDGHPFAGWELGEALINLIHEAAEGQDVTRERYLLDAGKDSGGTSAGSSEPGLTTLATAEP